MLVEDSLTELSAAAVVLPAGRSLMGTFPAAEDYQNKLADYFELKPHEIQTNKQVSAAAPRTAERSRMKEEDVATSAHMSDRIRSVDSISLATIAAVQLLQEMAAQRRILEQDVDDVSELEVCCYRCRRTQ